MTGDALHTATPDEQSHLTKTAAAHAAGGTWSEREGETIMHTTSGTTSARLAAHTRRSISRHLAAATAAFLALIAVVLGAAPLATAMSDTRQPRQARPADHPLPA